MREERLARRAIVQTHLTVTLLGGILLGFLVKPEQGAAYLIGSLLTLMNLLLLSLIWKAGTSKKSVAWITTIIVLKYPLLGVVAYLVLRVLGLPAEGFAAGFASVLITAVVLPALKLPGVK